MTRFVLIAVTVLSMVTTTTAADAQESEPRRRDPEGWPFDASEAKRRQEETARKLGTTVERALNLGEGVTLELVLIPAGQFPMGSPSAEMDREKDEVQHEVTLTKAYWIGKYEVTQEQYAQVIGNNPSDFKGGRNPVDRIEWKDAQEFCRKLSQQTRQEVRLPTEAEWEYACRAGTGTAFHTGETISTDKANYNGDHVYGMGPKGENRKKTIAVGSLCANAFGLYDMHGNVWEWCADWYGNYGAEAATDPQGPAQGTHRVFRGGPYSYLPRYCRSASRHGMPLNLPNSSRYAGFRVVVSLTR